MSTEGFSNEISEDLVMKYDNQGSIGADVIGGVVATVGDFAASTWNSLTPSSMNTTTEDLLERVDSNALRVYNENPDTIKTASFVGGLALGGGIALKGMSLARNGAKGVNFFSEAGQIAQKTKVADAFANAGIASTDYKKALYGLYAGTAGNVVLDSVAAEAAIVLTMNAHPMMEDYMKDLPSNFLTGIALGAGIGGTLGHIMDRTAVKGLKMGVEQEAMAVARGGYKEVQELENLSGQMAQRSRNAENWDNILQSTKPVDEKAGSVGPVRDLNNFTKNMLETFILKERGAIEDTFKQMAHSDILKLDKTVQNKIIQMITENPERFAGVDSIRFAKAVEELPLLTKEAKGLTSSTFLKPVGVISTETGNIQEAKKLQLPLTEDNKKGVAKGISMVYSPRFDSFMLLSDLKHYGTASDIIQDATKLTEGLQNNWHMIPRYDQYLEATRMTTSAVDADYLKALKYYDELPLDSFKGGLIKVSPDDTSMLQAIHARISKEVQADPSLAGELGVTFKTKIPGKELNKVDSLGVFDALVVAKEQQVKLLLEQGVPMETISLHTNVPLETIETYAVSGSTDLLSLNKPISSYSQASEIGTYLNTENRSLVLNTNLNKVPTAKLKATLNKQSLDTMDSDVKTAMLLGSQSKIAREIGRYYKSDTTAAQLAVLRAEINKVTDSGVGTKMFASSDFALRDLGAVGAIATSLGKDVNELINKQVKTLWEPMEGSFLSISKDPAALVELNTATKINASLKGYREVRNGQFFVQDATVPWLEIKDAAGKVIGKERSMLPVEYKGKPFIMSTPAVKSAYNEMQIAGRELLEFRNTLNAITGRPPIKDIGFWQPPFNPRSKNITYVWDKETDTTTLLFGKNQEELQTAVNGFKSTLQDGELGRRYEIINKSNQALYNKIKGRHDSIFMTSADSSTFHSGASAPEIVSTNADVLVDLANAYDHQIGYSVRSMLDIQLSDVMAKMDDISYLSQVGYRDQPLNMIQKMIQKPKDPGHIMRNTMLGNPNLSESIFWEKLSDITGGVSEFALTTISKAFEPILSTTKNLLGKGKSASDQDYLNLNAMLKSRGIPNPFEAMDDHYAKEIYHVQQISQAPNMTPQILALSNSLSATMMLRFMEVAQPICNMISLPILTSGAMGRKMSASFMDGVLDEKAKFSVLKTMYSGLRYSGSPEGKILVDEAHELGFFKPLVSEATEALNQARNLRPGLTTAVTKALESNLVKFLSQGADVAETLTRKQAFLTGAYMAKEAYPGMGKAGVITFARDFMDQAIGNYSGSQRPIMFQGTLGVAMGLFQTYMVTMAQDIYRLVEHGKFKQLSKMMLMQGSIFGAKSLPGFNYVSEMIGEHFSDQNMDLITGTYRALPTELADLVMYGLPSSLGPSFTSRGDVAPRIPDVMNQGINAIPAFNILKQSFAASEKVVKAAFTADASTGKAMLEALSLQSINRPIARMSELLSGNSITGKGNIVSGPDEIYTVQSAFSRAMATRPLEEVKSRDAIHLNTMYGSLDREARDAVTKKLKTHIRDGNLTPEIVEGLGSEYMRTGSPSGWRSAINHAIGQTTNPTGVTVRNYLKPNSPFNLMLDDMDL